MIGLEKLKGLVVCLASLLVAGGVAFGMLRDEPGRFRKGLCGQIVAADLAAGTPTLTIHLDEFNTPLSLDVAPGADVWIAFERATLRDVKIGQFASVRLGPDHRVVAEIHASGPTSEVVIRSVGPDGALTVVDAEDEDDEEITPRHQQVRLAEDAILRIGELPATPGDLRQGMRVPLEFAADGTTVNAIEAEADPALIYAGVILGKNVARRIIAVHTEDEEDRPIDLILGVPDDVRIILDGRPATLADLMPGSEAVLRTSEDREWVRAIRATLPERDETDDTNLAGRR